MESNWCHYSFTYPSLLARLVAQHEDKVNSMLKQTEP